MLESSSPISNYDMGLRGSRGDSNTRSNEIYENGVTAGGRVIVMLSNCAYYSHFELIAFFTATLCDFPHLQDIRLKGGGRGQNDRRS